MIRQRIEAKPLMREPEKPVPLFGYKLISLSCQQGPFVEAKKRLCALTKSMMFGVVYGRSSL